MIEEYIVYVNELEVLVQVLHRKIVSTGPELHSFVGKDIKKLNEVAKEKRWALIRILTSH